MRGLAFGHANTHPHLVKDTELDVTFLKEEGKSGRGVG